MSRLKLIIIAFIALPAICLWAVYFFEDLPVELEREKWETLHPGQNAYCQMGFVHNVIGNIEGKFLHSSELQFEDAATLYRRFFFRKKSSP